MAASDSGSVRVKFQGDARSALATFALVQTRFDQLVHHIEAKSVQLQSVTDNLARSTALGSLSVFRAISAQYAQLAKDVRGHAHQAAQGGGAFNVSVARQAQANLQKLTDDFAKSMGAAQRSAVSFFNNAGKAASQSLVPVGKALQRFEQQSLNVFDRIGKRIRSFAGGTTGIVAVTGIFGAAAFGREVAAFDKALTAIRTITKEASNEFEATRRGILDVAQSLHVSAVEIAEGFNDVVQAGIAAGDAMFVVEAGTKGAVAGLTDAKTSTSALIQTLNAYGIAAQKSEDVTGKLVRAVDLGVFTFEQLAANIGAIAPLAANTGVSLDELLSTLTSLTRQDANIEEVTTQVRSLLSDLIKPTERARERLNEYLGTTVEASIATRGFSETIRLIIQGANGSVEALGKVFDNVRGLNGVIKLASDSMLGFNNDMKVIASSGASDLNRALRVQQTSFAAVARAIRAVVTNQVLEFFLNNRNAIIATGQSIRNFLAENDGLVKGLVKTALALSGVVVTLGALKLAAFVASPAITGLTVGVAGLTRAWKAFTAFSFTKSFAQLALNAGQLTTYLNGTTSAFQAFTLAVQRVGPVVAGQSAIAGLALGFANFTVRIKAATAALRAMTLLAAPFAILAAKIALVATAGFKLGQFLSRRFGGVTAEEEKRAAALRNVFDIENKIAKLKTRDQQQSVRQKAIDDAEQYNHKLQKYIDLLQSAKNGNTEAAAAARALADELRQTANIDLRSAIAGQIAEIEKRIAAGRQKLIDDGKLDKNTPITDETALTRGDGKRINKAIETVKELDKLRDALRNIDNVEKLASQTREGYTAATERLNLAVNLTKESLKGVNEQLDELTAASDKLGKSSLEQSTDALEKQASAVTSLIFQLSANRDAILELLANPNIAPQAAQVAQAVLSQLEESLSRALETRRQYLAEVGRLLDEEQSRVLDKSLETQDELRRLEIEALRNSGKEREAEDAEAKRDRDATARDIRSKVEEEKKYRDDIEKQRIEAVKEQRLDDAARLDAISRQSEVLIRLYEEQLGAIDRVYDSELKKIDRNDKERAARKKKDEEEKRKAETLERLAALRLQLLEAIGLKNKDRELELRTSIYELESSLQKVIADRVDDELGLIQRARERVALLKEELKTAEKLNGAEGAADAARSAQSDILGSSDPVALRGALRDTLKGATTSTGVEEVKNAGRATFEAEAQALQARRQQAQREGDTEGVKEIDRQLLALREKYKIFTEEIKRRFEELIALERTRLEEEKAAREAAIEEARKAAGAAPIANREQVEKNLRKAKKIGEDETLIGRDPTTGKPVAVPTKDLEPATPGQQPPATPAAQPTPPGTAPQAPNAPSGQGGAGTGTPAVDPLGEATTKLGEAIDAAGKSFSDAATGLAVAIDMASAKTLEVVALVSDRFGEVVTVLNAHTDQLNTISDSVRKVRIDQPNG